MTKPGKITRHGQPPEVVFDLLYGRAREDSFIALGSRRPTRDGTEAPHYLCPISVSARRDFIPEILSWHLEQTKYICPNTISQRALLGKEPEEFTESLLKHDKPLYYQFYNKNVRELVAITIDLDVGRNEGLETALPKEALPSLSAAEALSLVLLRVFEGEFPAPSMAAYSGRGAYLMWLLKETDSDAPPLLRDDTRHQWELAVNKLLDKTKDLESDRNARRLANWYKAPGTIDTKTGRKVLYMTFGTDSPNNVPVYSLPELLTDLDIQTATTIDVETVRPVAALPPIFERREERKTDKRAGAQYRARFEDIEKLAVLRGGVFEGDRGGRHHTCLNYFSALRAFYAMSEPPDKAFRNARQRTIEFNEAYCQPPLTTLELVRSTPAKRSRREARTDVVTRDLHITRKEAERLNLKALIPAGLKREREERKAEKRKTREQRRELVDQAIEQGISAGAIIRKMIEQHNLEVSRQFVHARMSRANLPKRQKKLFNGG